MADPGTKCFSLSLGGKVSVEWAMLPPAGQSEDPAQIDFALSVDPAPFIKAGLDPTRLQVWKMAKRLQPDGDGAYFTSDRLVLAFHLG